ncbi:Saccharopine dehydrogenase-domain-containing protein [Jackrogersella minutella]|nr:Saccharopine dehydrogenase-domain-containing protein [Jackrogersella minutella]
MNTEVKEQRCSRKYDVLLLGATGYTGSLTAEYIVRHLPTNLKWAVAGRSKSKLETLAEKLKGLDPERLHQEIEVVSFDDHGQLDPIIKDSKVCISVVLYWRVGEVVVKSCIKNGTDYIDVAGDIPLLRTFINKYHEAAVNAHVALIHLCGVFAGTRALTQRTSQRTKEVIISITELSLSPSGGTVDSLMAENAYDPQVIRQAKQPWVLSPIEGVQTSMSTNFLGMRQDPVLGLLSASSLSADENRALVHRTWGLFRGSDQDYGPNFHMLNTAFLNPIAKLSFLRIIAKPFLPAPGEGPDVEKERHSRVKFEAVAVAESNGDSEPPRAYASFSYPSSGYHTTALFLAQGAASLLYSRNLGGHTVGGCLTPAFLGDDLLSSVQAAGASVSVNLV